MKLKRNIFTFSPTCLFVCTTFHLPTTTTTTLLLLLLQILCNQSTVRSYHERFHDEEHANLLNSMWLTAITFLCVGYGDIVPNTYCGRGITLTCGMVVSILTNVTNPKKYPKNVQQKNGNPTETHFFKPW